VLKNENYFKKKKTAVVYYQVNSANDSCTVMSIIKQIQGVSEIGTLILTGNRTRQKEQLFYLPLCRKTMFNSKKNWRDFSLK
jgi:hypothetical protein